MGKTTLATKYAIQHQKKGHQCYSNFELFGAYRIDRDTFGFFNVPKNSAIFLDEVSLWFSNRDFKTFKKEWEEYYRLSRKRKVYIYMFSQSWDVDKKIRDICDELYILDKWFNVISVAKKINRSIVLHQALDEDGNKENGTENFISEDFKFSSPFSWQFTFIPRWVKFFNSFEAPYLPPIKKIHYSFYNEAYLHKLKNYIYYKKDQVQDMYIRFKKWKKRRELSFIIDTEHYVNHQRYYIEKLVIKKQYLKQIFRMIKSKLNELIKVRKMQKQSPWVGV